MLEILWIGRGGQGAFTSAKLLGAAYSSQNSARYALVFPSFGPERRGAPVRAFTKLDTQVIYDRGEMKQSDFIVCLDDTLFQKELLEGLKPGGRIIINSKKYYENPEIVVIDAEKIAFQKKLPVINTIMLAALAEVSGIVSEEEIADAIGVFLPEQIRTLNYEAVQFAIQTIREGRNYETLFTTSK